MREATRVAASSRLLIGVVCVLAMLSVGGATAFADDEEEAPEAANPLDLAVPYYGELETKFSDGWTLTNCDELSVPDPIVFTCTPEAMTFSTDTFDEGFGEVVLAAQMANADRVVIVHYTVSLALPALPVAPELAINLPISAGTPFAIAHSGLGLACDGCREKNVHIEALTVEPATAGTLLVSDTHLVFASAPDYRGEVTLSYRAQDERDQWSEPIAITGFVSAPAREVLLGLHLQVALTDEPREFLVGDLVVDEGDGALDLIACSNPVFGTVSCRDGVIRYTPAPVEFDENGDELEGASADQFTATVFSQSGDQVRATVTLLRDQPADGPALVTGLLSPAADSVIPSLVPVPEDEAPTGQTPSIFAPFVGVLERRPE